MQISINIQIKITIHDIYYITYWYQMYLSNIVIKPNIISW